MESLRLLPIAMFLSGVLLIYSGIKGVYPMDVIRGNIQGFQDTQDPANVGYGANDNPFYAGTPYYRRPSTASAGLF